MAVLGASAPGLEALLTGRVAGLPEVILVHPALAFETGAAYLQHLYRAWRGEVERYLLVVEGSIFDETLAGEGSFSGLGEEAGRPVTVAEWARRLAPGASAVIAIGSCAAWGGIPAAAGSPTGAMGVTQFLGKDFHCASGLPVINVPGCAPHGDGFMELVVYVFLHLAGLIPLELDSEHRPAWLYHPGASLQPPRGFSSSWVTLSQDRPAIACPVPARGWMNRIGGCAAVGGSCIGCTLPDFADAWLPLARVE
jgi:hydrogenase small subunit